MCQNGRSSIGDYGPILLIKSIAGLFGCASQWMLTWSFADRAAVGLAIGIIFVILRRFWAAAVRLNSSLAPLGHRRRRRSSFRMRLRWANKRDEYLARHEEAWMS